jgi:hypothetical protein
MKITVQLGYALELVFVVAVAMALARVAFGNHDWSGAPAPGWWDYWWRLCFLVEPLMSGVALAGGTGLAIEVLRRRTPPVWGWGRWTWSLAGLGVLMNFAGGSGQTLIYWLTHPISPHQPPGLFYYLVGGWPDWFSNMILLTLVPALITARVAGVPVSASPDGREWAGRAFALLSVLWGSVFRVVPLFSG